MGETAVIVNELGEVAIDHYLLRRVDERTVVLGNGCICCTLRGDLADELREQGILVGLTGRHEDVLKIRPPLVFADEHAELLVSALDRIL